MPTEDFSKQCIWKTDGYQCQNIGHMSKCTAGEGPWYCRRHFEKLMGWSVCLVPEVDDSQETIDVRVNKIVPREPGENEHDWSMRCKAFVLDFIKKQGKKQPSKQWADRLKARAKAGEDVSHHALQAALSVRPDIS